jgi:RHS repeat-associated protein
VTTGGSTTVYDYLYDGDTEIGEYTGAPASNFIRRFVPGPAIDDVVAMIVDGGATRFPMVNHQGSTVDTTDTSAAKDEGPYTYDAFGNVTVSGGVQPTDYPFLFTGQRYDPETKLYYYRARYYSPTLGRFLQVDPVGYKDDLNLYAYVGNDPTNKIDPLGLSCSGKPGERTCQIDQVVDSKGRAITLTQRQRSAIAAYNQRYTNEVNRLDKAGKSALLKVPTKGDKTKTVSVSVSSAQLGEALADRTIAACPSCTGYPHTDGGVTTLTTSVFSGDAAPAFGGVRPGWAGSMAILRHEGIHGSPMEALLLKGAGATMDDLDANRNSDKAPGYLASVHQQPYDQAAVDLGP